MKRKSLVLIILVAVICLTVGLVYVQETNASKFLEGLKNTGDEVGDNLPTYVSPENMPAKVGAIVGYFFAFIGIVFMIVIMYGGFLYITSGGEADKAKKARKFITTAVIGAFIAVTAYTVTYFVVYQLENVSYEDVAPPADEADGVDEVEGDSME